MKTQRKDYSEWTERRGRECCVNDPLVPNNQNTRIITQRMSLKRFFVSLIPEAIVCSFRCAKENWAKYLKTGSANIIFAHASEFLLIYELELDVFLRSDNNELQLREIRAVEFTAVEQHQRENFLSLESHRAISNGFNRKLIVRVRFCEMEFFTVINGVKRDGPDSRWF